MMISHSVSTDVSHDEAVVIKISSSARHPGPGLVVSVEELSLVGVVGVVQLGRLGAVSG